MPKTLTLQEVERFIVENPWHENTISFKTLLNFLKYNDYAENALNNLLIITENGFDIEDEAIKEWLHEHLELFDKVLFFDFYTKYFSVINNREDTIFLISIKEYVDVKPFLKILYFTEVLFVLWSGQYHLDPHKRKYCQPGEYYYPEPIADDIPTDTEKLLKFLQLYKEHYCV